MKLYYLIKKIYKYIKKIETFHYKIKEIIKINKNIQLAIHWIQACSSKINNKEIIIKKIIAV